MSPRPKADADDDMLPEYDFTGAVRGKYYERYREGTNVILLDPDVAEVFRDATAVNEALRLLVSVAGAKATKQPTGTAPPKRPTRPLRPSSRGKRNGRRRRAADAARG
jgi:hypothetical protein